MSKIKYLLIIEQEGRVISVFDITKYSRKVSQNGRLIITTCRQIDKNIEDIRMKILYLTGKSFVHFQFLTINQYF